MQQKPALPSDGRMSAASFDRTLGVSLGTADLLGLTHAPSDAPPTTAYLMAGGRCTQNCSFCAQARASGARPDALSRVLWPPFAEDRTLDEVAQAWSRGLIQRTCLQMTAGRTALAETARLATALRARSAVPVCAAVYPRTLDQVVRLLDAGIEIAGFGLDAATPAAYAISKAPGIPLIRATALWRRRLELIEAAAERYPSRIGVHLIAGLGESERDLVRLFARLVHWGVTVALFAFTPVRGTPLEHRGPPSLVSYRRLQAALWLLVNGHTTLERCTWDGAGALTGFGLPPPVLRDLLAFGEAFRTSGCSGCNRPYYNERPSGPLYNYPRPLSSEEARRALADLIL